MSFIIDWAKTFFIAVVILWCSLPKQWAPKDTYSLPYSAVGYIYLSRCETHGAVHTEAHVRETHTCGQGKSTRWCDCEQPLTNKMTRGSKTGSLKCNPVYTRVCPALTCWNADVVGKDGCTLPTAHLCFELLSRRSLWERKQHGERDILRK